jgi:hypothetical protein
VDGGARIERERRRNVDEDLFLVLADDDRDVGLVLDVDPVQFVERLAGVSNCCQFSLRRSSASCGKVQVRFRYQSSGLRRSRSPSSSQVSGDLPSIPLCGTAMPNTIRAMCFSSNSGSLAILCEQRAGRANPKPAANHK